jgi:hypothetical protein
MPEQRFNFPAAANHVEHQDVAIIDAVDDNVLPCNETAQARAQISAAAAPSLGKRARTATL